MEATAVLSSFDKYTTFSFRGRTLTFRTCDGMEKYVEVLTWDNGYLEVLAKYRQKNNMVEGYIDLIEIANKAKLIVNEYIFSKSENGFISILNLNHQDCAMVVNRNGEIIETNTVPIEQQDGIIEIIHCCFL